MNRASTALYLAAALASLALAPAQAADDRSKPRPAKAAAQKPAAVKATAVKPVAARDTRRTPARPAIPAVRKALDGEAEARLIAIYKMIGQGNTREALEKAEHLVKTYPTFQLAQLVYGDLLAARTRPVSTPGDVPDAAARGAAPLLADLRQESLLRLRALRERPAPGMVPSQFLTLSPRTRHAIAIDASRSRLYLFENTANGLTLLADYYISVGKSGIEKTIEGDLRTPLGVYFITSNLNPRTLKDFYGSGALPINYPNQLDLKRGKTGSGIWLHGTPPQQFSRAPLATDGCVVLANPDLERIIGTVEVRTTPVVIAPSLKWVSPQTLKAEVKSFDAVLQGWHQDKSSGDMARLSAWYTPDFTSYGQTLAQWKPAMQGELKQQNGRNIEIKDVSYLRWTDASDTMVVTFGELVSGARTGRTKRQYWTRQGSQWKIFFEGAI